MMQIEYETDLEKSQKTSTIIKLFWLILIVVLLFATIKSAVSDDSDKIDSLYFNTSEIPFHESVEVNVSLIENATLYISRIDNETRLNISYPNETFYDSGSLEHIYFNVTVDSQILQNTTLIASFNLSSNVSNKTNVYSIIAYVTYDNELVGFTSEDFLTLQGADYYMNFTTDLLPLEKNLEFAVAGPSGVTMNVSCSEPWMSCKNNATFGNNNKTNVDVKIILPVSFEVGNYSSHINFTLGNFTRKANIYISLKKPSILIQKYVMTEKCYIFDEDGNVSISLECMEEQANYYHRQQLETYRLLKKNFNVCNCTCEEPETEFVIKGSLEDAIVEPYNSCKEDLKETRNQLSKCRDEDDNCQSERKECNNDLEKERKTFDKFKESTFVNITKHIASTHEDIIDREDITRDVRKSTIFWTIMMIAMVSFSSFVIYYLKKLKKHHDEEVRFS